MDRCEKCGSFKYTDVCPNYTDIEQLKIFINSREIDIKNIEIAIKEAKNKIKLLNTIN